MLNGRPLPLVPEGEVVRELLDKPATASNTWNGTLHNSGGEK
jgi:hypothetical protein